MIVINTIADFLSFSPQQQEEISKALRTKERLEGWLKALNGKKAAKKLPVMTDTPGWRRCRSCADHPGWVEDNVVRDDSDIHPSQIHKCIRNLWYACNGYAEQLDEFISPQLRLIFDMGHAVHDVLQTMGDPREMMNVAIEARWAETVERYGLSGAWGDCGYQKEVEIDPDKVGPDGQPVHPLAHQLWIKGHVDGVLPRYYVPSVPGLGDVSIKVVHEYKTINSKNFQSLNRAKPEHKWQAMIYAAVLDAPIVVFLYTNKDNCQMIDFPVPFDGAIWQQIHQKIVAVQQWSEANTPPDWPLTAAVKNPSECRDCGFRKICNPPARG